MVEIARSKAQSCGVEEEGQSWVHSWRVRDFVCTSCFSFADKDRSWWISPLFAHRAGIVDSANPDGGIIFDSVGAYAVVMTDGDEIPGPTSETFQYRAKGRDPGRYRLTAASPESRHPIRILRSHSLRSFWKPRAGVRYDGLCVSSNRTTKLSIYHHTEMTLLLN